MDNFLSLAAESLVLKEFLPRPQFIKSWAAVNIVFTEIHGDLHLAMIRRAINPQDPWSGHYAFPGGRLEEGESLFQGAVRETLEEIGLIVNEASLLSEFLRFQIRHNGAVTPYGVSAHAHFVASPLSPFEIDKDEVDEAFWLPVSKFLSNEFVTYKKLVPSKDQEYPCVSFDGHTIWGLSYFMLRELLLQWQGLKLMTPHGELHFNPEHLPPIFYHENDVKTEG